MGNRATLLTEVSTAVPSTLGGVTAANLRALLNDIINSLPTLFDANAFAGQMTFTGAPIIQALTGILKANGAGALTAIAAGQLPGTGTADDATAGNVGEFVTATGSLVSLATGTTANIASISLSPGDWEVFGVCGFNPAGGTTQSSIAAGSSATSATLPTGPSGGLASIAASLTTGAGSSLVVGRERYSLAVTTTIYLVAQASFGVSTMTATGKLSARRAR